MKFFGRGGGRSNKAAKMFQQKQKQQQNPRSESPTNNDFQSVCDDEHPLLDFTEESQPSAGSEKEDILFQPQDEPLHWANLRPSLPSATLFQSSSRLNFWHDEDEDEGADSEHDALLYYSKLYAVTPSPDRTSAGYRGRGRTPPTALVSLSTPLGDIAEEDTVDSGTEEDSDAWRSPFRNDHHNKKSDQTNYHDKDCKNNEVQKWPRHHHLQHHHPDLPDSVRYDHVLPDDLTHDVLDKLFDEIVVWGELLQKGKPLPRLVAVQGDVDELLGIEPLYRDSMEYQPELTSWTPTVERLRDLVSGKVMQRLNHATICCYRHSEDYFSENSCATLDLIKDSCIAKLSLGAPRTVLFRPKRFDDNGTRRESPRPTTKIDLTHGSLLILGPQTNRQMTHEIKSVSKYAPSPLPQAQEQSPPKVSLSTAAGGDSVPGSKRGLLYDPNVRVCITFRNVGTFQTENGDVFGQGATSPTLTGVTKQRSVLADKPEKRMVVIKKLRAAFSHESRRADFDYLKHYGEGFDVVPFRYLGSSLEDLPLELDEFFAENTPEELDLAAPKTPSASPKYLVKSDEETGGQLKIPESYLDGNVARKRSLFEEEKKDDSGDFTGSRYISKSLLVGKHDGSEEDDIPGTPPSLADSENESMGSPSQHSFTAMSVAPFLPNSLPGHNGVALLALDLQNDFLGDDPDFFFGKLGSPIAPRRDALLSRIGELANEVRRMGGVVFFVKSQYGAWSSPQTQKFGSLGVPGGAYMEDVNCCGVSSEGADLHPEAEMLIVKQDIIMIKEWYSAFMGTTLDQQLRKLKVGHVVVCGVTTNHSVSATVRSAANLGYHVILSSDGTAQIEETQQKQTEEKLSEYYSILLERGETLSSVIAPNPCDKADSDDSVSHDSIPDMSKLEINPVSRLSGFGAGDSIIVPDFLEKNKARELYESMLPGASSHVEWTENKLNPRVTGKSAYQFEPNDLGHLPVYRSNAPQPWDRNFKGEGFSDSVHSVKALVESQTGHKLNWGEFLCYRDGSEGMDWNADNNIDVRAGSFIAAVSLGGDRILELKPKKDDSSLPPQRILLQHNSLVLLGPETTRLFLHSIPPDESSTEPHIHVTFLDVATFFAKKESRLGVPELYGQGSEYSSLAELQEAAATRRIIEQLGMTLAGVYTLSTVPPGRGGSLGFSILCTVVATAATAMWFHAERFKAWQAQQYRLSQVYQDCFEEPLSIEEARVRIWQQKK